MDDSRRSIAAGEDSISMYLSFDTDDTLSSISKWQSVVSQSQYMELQGTALDLKLDKTLEDKRNILKDVNSMDHETDHVSPLRPFDKSILNRHNALSSTPSKNATLPEIRLDLTQTDTDLKSNKENAHPSEESGSGNAGDNSTLSSSVDITASTVKANTLRIDATPDISVKHNKTNGNNVYPLCADVLLENITEDFPVSNEEDMSLSLAEREKKSTEAEEVVNEVSELISKVLKVSKDSVKTKVSKPNPLTDKFKVSSIPLPRPRRSMLPTFGTESRGYMVKQRMSVVVKTTLNSPARRLSTIGGLAASRRSYLPASKGRKSVNPTAKIMKTTTVQAQTTVTPVVHELKDNGIKPLKRLNIGSVSQSGLNKNRCKYCDKNFAIERALHIHLMQNCDKIPPSEKRKLQFTDLNHVKKAEVPKLASTIPQQGNLAKSRPINKTPTTVGKASSSTGSHIMAPPSAKKVPKNVAHAGVCRTPTKSVLCHTCKQSFKSVLEYTDHCLSKHSKSRKD